MIPNLPKWDLRLGRDRERVEDGGPSLTTQDAVIVVKRI